MLGRPSNTLASQALINHEPLTPPPGLSEEAKPRFIELSVANAQIKPSAAGLLASYVEAELTVAQMTNVLNQEGYFVSTASTMKAHPAVAIRTANMQALAQLATKLGLAPASRNRVARADTDETRPKTNVPGLMLA